MGEDKLNLHGAYRDRDTGMVKVLVRDDGDRVYIADMGNEADSIPMSREDFDAKFEELGDEAFLGAAASTHSVAVGAVLAEEAETDEEDAPEEDDALYGQTVVEGDFVDGPETPALDPEEVSSVDESTDLPPVATPVEDENSPS